MKRVHILGDQRVGIEEVGRPEPGPGQARIRVAVSALCGSEMPDYRGKNALTGNGGHELVGTVDAVGPGTSLPVGTRVGVNIVVGCGECDFCRAGDTLYCPKKSFYTNGHAEYYAAPERAFIPIPENMDWETAVLATGDTLGVAARALKKLSDIKGRSIVVLGMGPIGLGCCRVFSFNGAAITAVDFSVERLRLAKTCGAAAALRAASSTEDAVTQCLAALDGKPPDIVAVAAGVPAALDVALRLVRCAGTILQVGCIQEARVEVNRFIVEKELCLVGSWYYTRGDVPGILRMCEKGMDVSMLITHRYALADAGEAYRVFAAGASGKVILAYGG